VRGHLFFIYLFSVQQTSGIDTTEYNWFRGGRGNN